MPPPKRIFIDTDRILRTIAAIAQEQREASWRETGGWGGTTLAHRQQHADNANWVARDLQLLLGQTLTASERIRAQQAMRRLEADGLVALDSRHVRLTDAGRAILEGCGNG